MTLRECCPESWSRGFVSFSKKLPDIFACHCDIITRANDTPRTRGKNHGRKRSRIMPRENDDESGKAG